MAPSPAASSAPTTGTGSGSQHQRQGRSAGSFLGLSSVVGGGDTTVTKARTHDGGNAWIAGRCRDAERQRQDRDVLECGCPWAAADVTSGSGKVGNIVTDGSGNSTVYLQGATIADTPNAIDLATGVKTAANFRRHWPRDHRYQHRGFLGFRQRHPEDQHRNDHRPVHHRHGNALSALEPHRRHRHRHQLRGIAYRRRRRHQRQDAKLHLVQRWHRGRRHLRRRYRRYGQDAGQLNTKLQANTQTATIDSTGKLAIRHPTTTLPRPPVGGGVWRA